MFLLYGRIACILLLILLRTPRCWSSEPRSIDPPSASAVEPAVVAEGVDGFRVTDTDVQALKDFFSTHTMFQTTDQEYRRYTVQTFLFAREAEKLGLVLPEGAVPEDRIQKHLALANIYIQYRLATFPISKEAVQSYYRAFPERFLKDPQAEKWRQQPMAHIAKEDLVPEDAVASRIADFMRGQLRKRVEMQAYQDLMAAYHVALK